MGDWCSEACPREGGERHQKTKRNYGNGKIGGNLKIFARKGTFLA